MYPHKTTKFKIFRPSLPVTGMPVPILNLKIPGSYRLFTPPLLGRGWKRNDQKYNVGKFNTINNYKKEVSIS